MGCSERRGREEVSGAAAGRASSLPGLEIQSGTLLPCSTSYRTQPLPPAPSPKRERGEEEMALLLPSPLRGGGWGEGLRSDIPSSESSPCVPCRGVVSSPL